MKVCFMATFHLCRQVSQNVKLIVLSPKDATEDLGWVHEGQSGCAGSMDALILMPLNGCCINIWTTNTSFTWR